MARLARADLFDPAEISVVHCINRCVRRCFLCGDDPHTGQNYDHRKAWLERRLAFLAGQFGIDVLGFAILSNHFHLVLRNRPDVVAAWSDSEVASRWLTLCPLRKTRDGEPAEPTDAELDTIRNLPERLAEIRRRLSDVSWLMRFIAEPIARRANREDQVSGRFWQGRFKAVKLCDEAAILACAVYVDLNPIRAGLATTPETSDFTSVQRRIESLRQAAGAAERRHARNVVTQPDAWLAPITLREESVPRGPQPSGTGARASIGSSSRASDKGFLPLSTADYLQLVDWTSRQIVRGRGGRIPAELPPLLSRVGIAECDWLPLVTRFGRLFHRVAGAPHTLAHLARPIAGRRFRSGHAALLGRR
jgi:REP element-mobilizing transposase RayT